MKNMTAAQKKKIEETLSKLSEVAQELANVIEDTDYKLSGAAPTYLSDTEDFAYEIVTFVEDELTELMGNTRVDVKVTESKLDIEIGVSNEDSNIELKLKKTI